jgi:hypothetical protein
MSDNILTFKGATFSRVEPDAVLDGAKGQLTEVFVIGVEDEGGGMFLASSTSNKPDLLWMLKMAEQRILADDK